MDAPLADPAPPDRLRFHVSGMDCPSCAGKIETALKRVPGIRDVRVSFPTERLEVTAEDPATITQVIADRLHALGFEATPANAAATDPVSQRPSTLRHKDQHAHPLGTEAGERWWTGFKARLVVVLGLLLVIGFAVATLDAQVGDWAYGPAILVGLGYFGRRALQLARAGSPCSIEMLMSIAAAGAVAIGAVSEAAIVVFLFALGELLENVAAGQARAGIRSLAALMPKTALIETDGGLAEVPAASLHPGQVVVVRPGDRVPADGRILEGQSALDDSPVTGESVPVPKTVGDGVFAGSINATGQLRIEVTTPAADNTIARILQLVEEAQSAKSPTARFIDRFSAWYTPAAVVLAGLVIILPPLLAGADWHTWIYRGLALLLIACPCALVLSTPAAIASGLAAGTRRGLLVKGGAALEQIGRVRTVAFDKTGTLTEGRPRVTSMLALDGNEAGLLRLAAAVEQGSSHPLGAAILRRAAEDKVSLPPVRNARVIEGKAVEGTVMGRNVVVGSPRYAAEVGMLPEQARSAIEGLEAEGNTVVLVLVDGQARGLIAVRDEPRPDAAAAMKRLTSLGVEPLMLTGDNRRVAAAIAGQLGLRAEAELLPQQKLERIAALRFHGPVAMVGDGINDAPALAAASVGIAMGGGTDVALETADAAILRSRVGDIAGLIELSRATLANIRQNITIALGLKALFLVTTLLGATNLWVAILADTGATVLVTLNALRLLGYRIDDAKEARPGLLERLVCACSSCSPHLGAANSSGRPVLTHTRDNTTS